MSRNTITGHLYLQQGAFTLDANLSFPGTGVTGLYGPSGCGKTTLLRCIAGLEKRVRGKLVVAGEHWHSGQRQIPAHKRPVGLVFQQANLFPHLNVRDNLLFGYRRIVPQHRQLHLEDVSQWLGLAPLLERMPVNLSGGERQRVAVGRALLTSPRLLLMDEPLTALDAASKRDILPYLENLQRVSSTPILYVSHHAGEVARLADHLLLMRNGAIVEQGLIETLVNRLEPTLDDDEQRFAVVKGSVIDHLGDHQLTRLQVGGDILLVPRVVAQPGQSLRLRIQARDVSLCLLKPKGTTILNIVEAFVDSVAPAQAGQRLVLLRTNGAHLLARISDLSYQRLKLEPGQRVFAQIKSAALLHQS